MTDEPRVQRIDTQVRLARAVVENLRPAELAAELSDRDMVLVDVREPDELRAGTISGAISVPRGVVEFVAAPGSAGHRAGLDSTRRVVVFCDTGARSALVVHVLYGDVGVGEVGDEHLVAVPVNIGEGELRARVWEFAAGDHAAPVGPAVEEVADEVGDLCDLGVVTPLAAVGGDRWLPGSFRDVDQDFGDIDVELVTDHEPHLALAAVVDELV